MTAPPRGALANRRVLIAEDEYFIARDIARALHALGAEVVGPVASRDEVQAILATGERLDAAILDINLNGEMVARHANQTNGAGSFPSVRLAECRIFGLRLGLLLRCLVQLALRPIPVILRIA
ncbi:response regulator [Microvirga vignae]|uniref:response regulator n=1 Tax=Microvirga vignae TaxID=1225564 RepID=UPI000699CD66|nr:response regulator [Microvirga vignae]